MSSVTNPQQHKEADSGQRIKKPRIKRATVEGRILQYCSDVRSGKKFIVPMVTDPGRPSIYVIARDIGVCDYALRKSVAGKQFRDLVKEVGVGDRRMRPRAPTLGEIREPLLTDRREELERAPGSLSPKKIDGRVNNLRWALKKVVNSAPDGENSPARKVLMTAYDDALRSGAKTLAAEVMRALDYLDRVDRSAGLPLEFAAAIRVAAARIGMSQQAIKRHVGAERAWFIDSARGPSAGMKATVTAIEELLGLVADTLWSRVNFTSMERKVPRSYYPEVLQADAELRYLVQQFLKPEDYQRPEAEFRSRCQLVADYLIKEMPDRSRPMAYGLKDWPARASAELDRIIAVKRALLNHDDLLPGETRWSPFWAERIRHELSYFFGYLRGPLAEPPRVDVDKLTLALLLKAELVLKFSKWRVLRRGPERAAEGLSEFDTGMFAQWRSWFKPVTGLLWQQPGLAEHLAPIPGVITEAEIAEIRRDWAVACAKAHGEYDAMYKSYSKIAREIEGGQEEVSSVLELPNPLVAFSMILRGLQAEAALLQPGSLALAKNLMRQVYIGMQSQCGFRTGTIVALILEYLIERDGRFVLCVPREHFKNADSSVFKIGRNRWRDFERVLLDKGGLYDAIRAYLSWGRARMTQQESGLRDAKALFFNRYGQPLLRGPCSDLAGLLTARFVAWNPLYQTGVKGQLPFSNHCFRHILATGTLKTTGGNRVLAADAISDTVEVVEANYLKWLPPERAGDLEQALNMGLEDAFALV